MTCVNYYWISSCFRGGDDCADVDSGEGGR